MKIDCPHCGVHGSVDDSLSGKKLRCPECSKIFLVTDDMLPDIDDISIGASSLDSQGISSEAEPQSPTEADVQEFQGTETEEGFVDESEPEAAEEPFAAPEDEYEGDVAMDDLLGPEDESEDFFAEGDSELEVCSKCGESFQADFLETVGSSRYCALCLPEDAAVDLWAEDDVDAGADREQVEAETAIAQSLMGAEDDDEGFAEDDFGGAAGGPPQEKCSGCGESFHPDFMQVVDSKYYCGVCQPDVVEELSDDESEEMAAAPAQAGDFAAAAVAIDEDFAAAFQSDEDFAEDVFDTVEEEPLAAGSDFSVGEIIKEAWRKTRGAKGSIWAALIVMSAVLCGLGYAAFYYMQGADPAADPTAAMGVSGGIQLLSNLLSNVFFAGLMLIGVRRALEQRVSWTMVFAGFSRFFSITVAFILQTVLILIGFLLLILPGIYLSVGYGLTLPLILEKGLGPWQAMEASRKAIHKKWWTVLGLYLVMMLLCLVAAIPLGLGLIWTVPMCFVLLGVLYARFFGSAGVVAEEEVEEEGGAAEEEIPVESA